MTGVEEERWYGVPIFTLKGSNDEEIIQILLACDLGASKGFEEEIEDGDEKSNGLLEFVVDVPIPDMKLRKSIFSLVSGSSLLESIWLEIIFNLPEALDSSSYTPKFETVPRTYSINV